MKIGNPDNKAIAPAGVERAAGGVDDKAKGRSVDGAAGGPSATVELSAGAATLAAAAAGPSFDAGKVAAIAQAIREGRFQVNAEAIADKLIANAAELLGKTAE